MNEKVKRLLDAHNIDLEQESVIFALQDCAVHAYHHFEHDTVVAEIFTADNIIVIPLKLSEVL